MPTSWITLYPQWYMEERQRLARHYPEFRVYEPALDQGMLICFGELKIRISEGTIRQPVMLFYPNSTPFKPPTVLPLASLPEIGVDGKIKGKLHDLHLDYHHQMPDGTLCLFQYETRVVPGGDTVRGIDALRRSEQWFVGFHTKHWPPDSAESELESHFEYVTDVLLSDVFFSPELEGFGRFLMVADLGRLAESNSQKSYPFIVTAVSEESGIFKTLDARNDLSRIYPWIQMDAWSPNSFVRVEARSLEKPDELQLGYWWSLPEEPRPFHDGQGLLRELAPVAPNGDAWPMISSALKTEISTSTHHFFGLRYPGRRDEIEWLMTFMSRGERKDSRLIKSDEEKRREFENSKVGCVRVHSVRPAALRLRNTGVVDDAIDQKVVALIGLGALGAIVAELLAKAGVGRFLLCDSDRLSTGNVARHVGGLNEFGAPKTHVTIRRLLEINPFLGFAEGDVISGSAVSDLDRLAKFMEPADVTIATTADEGVESIINQIAVIHRKTAVYGRALRRGSMGRVFMVRPGTDACKRCLSDYARNGRQGIEVPVDWIDVTETGDDILLHECGRPVIAASAVDLAFVAALIARVALDVLEGRSSEVNHWLWTRLPAPDVDPRLDAGMCTFAGRLEPRFGCPACQEPDVVRLIMSEEVRNAIVAATEASPETETGGVLIGFVDELKQAIVIRATGPGPKAEKSTTGFSRDIEYIQAEIDRAASELSDRGVYIGEWHSHLEPDPQPSAVDIQSLFGIAETPYYLTRCPVLVISGLDPSTKKVAIIKPWTFLVGGRAYPLDNETVKSEVIAELKVNSC